MTINGELEAPESQDPDALEDTARQALVGRRELRLLEDRSVLAMARLLAQRCRRPDPWIRAAVATLDRFAREVAHGDLPGLLAAGRDNPRVAERCLQSIANRHDGLTLSQLASLAFGPRLWWTVAGVEVPWRPLSSAGAVDRGGLDQPDTIKAPLPGQRTDVDVRLLLLAVIGTGATDTELLGVRVRDAGRLDASGKVVADPLAEPLAVTYRGADDGAEHVTFLSFEARSAVLAQIDARGPLGADDPLLLPSERVVAATAGARSMSTALIGAGNDVNVTMCRATGDFFRGWGMPGARFEDRNTEAEDAPSQEDA